MRFGVVVAMLCLAACTSEKLAQQPPAGVDLSGRWKLNEADSDDPQRLLQAQFDRETAPQSTTSGGSGGRGGRQGGGRGGAGGMNPGGPAAPAMPSGSVLGAALRWPGKQLEIKQVVGVVAFTSDSTSRVCQPMDAAKHRHHSGSRDDGSDASGRDASPRGRESPPPRCGWDDKTLVVQGGDPDEDHPPFEEHYSLSDDGQRLVEVVGIKGGRSNGFTLSRVWDRQQ
jgi:hypothetical protein